jgi:SHAQKYF class myb-like DNA-binding protein
LKPIVISHSNHSRRHMVSGSTARVGQPPLGCCPRAAVVGALCIFVQYCASEMDPCENNTRDKLQLKLNALLPQGSTFQELLDIYNELDGRPHTSNPRKRGVEEEALQDSVKRHRFHWTPHLHRLFVSAIFDIGMKHASPKAVLQYLESVDCNLTTEHIKSHLQKYRLHIQRSRQEFLELFEVMPTGTDPVLIYVLLLSSFPRIFNLPLPL